jgi:hypothetical protein
MNILLDTNMLYEFLEIYGNVYTFKLKNIIENDKNKIYVNLISILEFLNKNDCTEKIKYKQQILKKIYNSKIKILIDAHFDINKLKSSINEEENMKNLYKVSYKKYNRIKTKLNTIRINTEAELLAYLSEVMVVIYTNSELSSLTNGHQKSFIIQMINDLLKNSKKELTTTLKKMLLEIQKNKCTISNINSEYIKLFEQGVFTYIKFNLEFIKSVEKNYYDKVREKVSELKEEYNINSHKLTLNEEDIKFINEWIERVSKYKEGKSRNGIIKEIIKNYKNNNSKKPLQYIKSLYKEVVDKETFSDSYMIWLVNRFLENKPFDKNDILDFQLINIVESSNDLVLLTKDKEQIKAMEFCSKYKKINESLIFIKEYQNLKE